jgi:hypothetical protein
MRAADVPTSEAAALLGWGRRNEGVEDEKITSSTEAGAVLRLGGARDEETS